MKKKLGSGCEVIVDNALETSQQCSHVYKSQVKRNLTHYTTMSYYLNTVDDHEKRLKLLEQQFQNIKSDYECQIASLSCQIKVLSEQICKHSTFSMNSVLNECGSPKSVIVENGNDDIVGDSK